MEGEQSPFSPKMAMFIMRVEHPFGSRNQAKTRNSAWNPKRNLLFGILFRCVSGRRLSSKKVLLPKAKNHINLMLERGRKSVVPLSFFFYFLSFWYLVQHSF